MNLSSLLELALKSDEVIEVIELYELTVTYDFDRLHENSPDVYWASSTEAGFELRFNNRQVLDTIFMYVLARGDFSAIDPSIAGVPLHRTFADARIAFQSDGIPFGASAEGHGWIKGNFGNHAVHYEFNQDGALALVTIMAVDA